jgi:hypothetical protein
MKRRQGFPRIAYIAAALLVALTGWAANDSRGQATTPTYGKSPLPGKYKLAGLGMKDSSSALTLKKTGKSFTITHMHLYLPPLECTIFPGSYATLTKPEHLKVATVTRFGTLQRFWIVEHRKRFDDGGPGNVNVRVGNEAVNADLALTFSRGIPEVEGNRANGGELDFHTGPDDECDLIFYAHH